MELALSRSRLRPWRPDDAPSLAHHGDSHAIWRNLRDAFPRPFTLARAEAFIAAALAATPMTRFAIEVDGAAVGSIGLALHPDVDRVSAELGYWLGEAYWGRGVMTEVVAAFTRAAIAHYRLTRIHAAPYATTVGSHRVLERAGFVLEGRLRRSVVKEGVVLDQLLYAFVPDDDGAPPPA